MVGDEITDDTIVVDSASEDPTIRAPEDTTTSIVDETQSTAVDADPALSPDTEAQAGNGDGGSSGDTEADAPAETATTTEPEQLLTPENFDRDEVLAHLDVSGQLTNDTRSTLRALVEGASANPDILAAATRLQTRVDC